MRTLFTFLLVALFYNGISQTYGYELVSGVDSLTVNCSISEKEMIKVFGEADSVVGNYEFVPSFGKFKQRPYSKSFYYRGLGIVFHFESSKQGANFGNLRSIKCIEYSKLSFHGIQVGMDSSEVREILLNPSSFYVEDLRNYLEWFYDIDGTDVTVSFDSLGKVSRYEVEYVMYEARTVFYQGDYYRTFELHKNRAPKEIGSLTSSCVADRLLKHGSFHCFNKKGEIKNSKEFHYGKKFKRRFLGLKNGLWIDDASFVVYWVGIPVKRFKLKPCF